jgi:murein DD-endopeptidase MepM/ murein hydrolase activator NlpD
MVKRYILSIVSFLFLSACVYTQVSATDGKPRVEFPNEDGVYRFNVINPLHTPITIALYFTTLEKITPVEKFTTISGYPGWSAVVRPLGTSRIGSLNASHPDSRFYMMYYYRYGDAAARHDSTLLYTLPFASGTAHRVGQAYDGSTHNGEHRYAVDWDMPVGTPVHAARSGVVVQIKDEFDGASMDESARERTNGILIAHTDGTLGSYDHIRRGGAVAAVGERVRAGQLIAYSGNVGYSSGPHLHFAVYSPLDAFSGRSWPVRFKTTKGNVHPATGLLMENP